MFKDFRIAYQKNLDQLIKDGHEFYTVDITGDELWELYLDSFPKGTNPLYSERTEHDCQCCRQFIKNIGNVVVIIDGKVTSLWKIPNLVEPYKTVAKKLDKVVSSKLINGIFVTNESKFGNATTLSQLEGELV